MLDNRYGIDESTLRVVVPALYATQPHSNMSDRYAYANTRELIEPLLKRGWRVGTAGQAKTRAHEKLSTTNFMLSLFHPSHTLEHVASQPRIIVQDSHDGTKALRINLGIFRYVCANGLIIGDSLYHRRIKHNSNDIIGDALMAFDETIESVDKLKQLTERLSHTITIDRMVSFAEDAYHIRYTDDPTDGRKFNPNRLLYTRRTEDSYRTAWNVFNVVQENLLKGGQQYYTSSMRKSTIREITSIHESTRVNQELFDLALNTLAE